MLKAKQQWERELCNQWLRYSAASQPVLHVLHFYRRESRCRRAAAERVNSPHANEWDLFGKERVDRKNLTLRCSRQFPQGLDEALPIFITTSSRHAETGSRARQSRRRVLDWGVRREPGENLN